MRLDKTYKTIFRLSSGLFAKAKGRENIGEGLNVPGYPA